MLTIGSELDLTSVPSQYWTDSLVVDALERGSKLNFKNIPTDIWTDRTVSLVITNLSNDKIFVINLEFYKHLFDYTGVHFPKYNEDVQEKYLEIEQYWNKETVPTDLVPGFLLDDEEYMAARLNNEIERGNVGFEDLNERDRKQRTG